MPIEILLRKSIQSLGKVGEVVKVRPGYARNYLFPYGLAVTPTEANRKLAEKDKAVEAAEEAELAKQRQELLAKLAGTSVTIEAKSNPEGHLFGSVGAKQVADALTAKGFSIEERQVKLEAVKQLGEFDVPVHLAADAETTIKLLVVDEVTKTTSKTPAAEPVPAVPAAAPAKGAKPAAKGKGK